ncbi:5-formyltetrahydrofolate cyclo-ligase family protein [Corynebacterium atrinae]|uniref:5-formyltetrahydrofolate cyclo-ligase n=1 Tax=Corynebacterium atrinae TaxID=1336740 RepID=UPI0025B47D13|nr:5-formyltetrahydrofolate cyclo-ligase [Corynebacterium atrinae]WJY62826.1 5-formyltetrahydrofolate cyclo-ligase family protein [Corynebacterium atrinae]
MDTRERKTQLRELLQQARRAMSMEDTHRENSALIAHAASLLRSLSPADTAVAAYAPLVGEPGGKLLLDALHGEASALLLPVSLPGGKLDWARYEGRLALSPGALGIAEPTGTRLGPDALQSCSLVFVPALAVSPTGIRLGKGGGFYDRALSALSNLPHPPRTAMLLYNGEIRDDIPAEAHDMPVDLAITPTGIRTFS